VTKILFIDHREKSGLEDLVRSYCDKNDLKYQTRENMITDYSFSEVGIEAKSISDYMGSLYSGHLERQLLNLDDNYTQAILLVWGTLDSYIASARKGGHRIPFGRAFNAYIGSLARFCNDFDVQLITLPDRSSAARFICKRFEKAGTLSSTSTYRLLRKTSTEDRRVDVLRSAGCSEALAKRLLDEFGSLAEIASQTPKELMVVKGLGKITAKKLSLLWPSEEKVPQERVRMARA
jgi:ERCC4-type nuclease